MEQNNFEQNNSNNELPVYGGPNGSIQLSDHFNTAKLLRFAMPSIVMMLFTSIYGVVDGLFISNYVGETAFASVNLIMPYCMIFAALGSVFGVGGSALVAKIRGEGRQEESNRVFSMLVACLAVVGLLVCAGAQLFLPQVVRALGATESMYDNCVLYARIILSTLPVFLMQYAFQSFMITAERPNVGLVITLCAGVSNMIGDFLLVGVFHFGVAGAAAATCVGQLIGGIAPLIYIATAKGLPLKFVKFRFMPKMLGRAVVNGAADGITNVAMSVVNMVYNVQLMKHIGEYGVSAYGIIMYVNFVFVAVYLGYAMGVAPIYSFNCGANNRDELKNVFNKSFLFVTAATVVLTGLAELTAGGIAGVFSAGDTEFRSIAARALRLYSLCYLITGFNIFTTSLFAALNEGKIAGILSFLRTFIFQLAAVLILPMIMGSDGIWLAIVVAEAGEFIPAYILLKKYQPKYGY